MSQLKRGLTSRKLALEILVKTETQGAFTNLLLKETLDNNSSSLSQKDRAFLMAMVQGVLRTQGQLDQSLAKLSKHPLAKMPVPLLCNLRLALYQIDHMNVESRAAVDLAVELAKVTGHKGQAGFVNGLLRNHLRQSDESKKEPSTKEQSNEPEDLSTEFSMPLFLVKRWHDRFGAQETRKLLEAQQKPARLTLRVNSMAIETKGYKKILEEKGIKCQFSQLAKNCLVLDRNTVTGAITQLPGFADGIFSVQDEAAAFVSQVVNPQQSDLVYDLCAAPGGKTMHMAELMEGKGKIVAFDKQESRLSLIRENRKRLGHTNVMLEEADSTTYRNPIPADKILIDAPCTGTGVINKRGDIRLKLRACDFENLQKIQLALLENSVNLLKPGGLLVYSTCSIEPEENEDVIALFRKAHPDFQPVDLSYASHALTELKLAQEAKTGQLYFLPSRQGFSGFFVAALKAPEV
jgi:16S rRNA (cytosine967-C5)-methyltransferase